MVYALGAPSCTEGASWEKMIKKNVGEKLSDKNGRQERKVSRFNCPV